MDNIGKAKKFALKLLNVRDRSEKEIISSLTENKFSEHDIIEVVLSLKEKGLINDLRFAKEWVDYVLRTSPRSQSLIRQDLVQKGIPENTIEEALSSVVLSEKEVLKNIAAKRLKGLDNLPKTKAKGKLFRYLVSKGFDIEMVDEVIAKVIDDEIE